MIKIILPDGKQLEFVNPTSVADVAKAIGAGLAKAALAAEVNGQLVDLSFLISQDAKIKIITSKDPEGLELIRHSTAHLMAHAVRALFPEAQPVIGPVIEDGFYYDFFYPAGFSESDLALIEAKMYELAKQNLPLTREEMDRHEAIKFFTKAGETYKVRLLEEIPEPIVSFYRQGDFVDLCRGPHVPNTSFLKAFKLTKLAGAYWRGDSQNEMLQRIYGTAWPTPKELDEYLAKIELAKQRDHRLIGKKMDLFHLQEEAPGMIFWHPHGWTIYTTIKNFIAKRMRECGYQEINTPQLIDRSLWEKSGHWDKYAKIMFVTESENRTYAIKPMSCPGHIQVFKQGIKSYRDLPLRLCEFGYCHRNEVSGTLHGIMRIRGFTQDDAHIFCTESQIAAESKLIVQQILDVYAALGFKNIQIRLATRPPERIGADEIWDKAEEALANVLTEMKIPWKLAAGEGAFYGPKIEFHLQDCLGRVWQCGTLQVDFSMPERLGAQYVTENGERKTPVMLHRATLGSLERFIGILLEETGGDLPLWLAPVQAVVLNITDEQLDYAREVVKSLQVLGFRVNSDLRNEKINFKIREHSMARVPFLLVAGNREAASKTLSVRTRTGEDLGTKTIDEIIKLLQ
jgi:threonyl-tRNA synthetase